MVVPSGFEPESLAPKAGMIDHYTTGLRDARRTRPIIQFAMRPMRYVGMQSVTSTSTNVPRGTSSRTTTGL